MPDLEIHRVPLAQCPHCGHRLNAAQFGEQQRPRPGDLAVCIGCGEAVQFGPRLKLRRVPLRVLALLLPDEKEDLIKVQSHVRALLAAQVP